MVLPGLNYPLLSIRDREINGKEQNRDQDFSPEPLRTAYCYNRILYGSIWFADKIPFVEKFTPWVIQSSIQNIFPREDARPPENYSFVKKTLLVISIACLISMIAYQRWKPSKKWSPKVKKGIGAAAVFTTLLFRDLLKTPITPQPYQHNRSSIFPINEFVLPSFLPDFKFTVKEKIRHTLLPTFVQEMGRFAEAQTSPQAIKEALQNLSCLEIPNDVCGNIPVTEQEQEATNALANSYSTLIANSSRSCPGLFSEENPLVIGKKEDQELSKDIINAFSSEPLKNNEALKKISHIKVHANKTPIMKLISMLSSFGNNAQITIHMSQMFSKTLVKCKFKRLEQLFELENVHSLSLNISFSCGENVAQELRRLNALLGNSKIKQAIVAVSANFGDTLTTETSAPISGLINKSKIRSSTFTALERKTSIDEITTGVFRTALEGEIEQPNITFHNFQQNPDLIDPINGNVVFKITS